VAQVTVRRADGSTWLVDDTQLVQPLPALPADGSYVTVQLGASVFEHWFAAGGQFAPVESPTDMHDWGYVVARDINRTPVVGYSQDDRHHLQTLLGRLRAQGAQVPSVEGHIWRVRPDQATTTVALSVGAQVEHLGPRAAVMYALGMLGAAAQLLP
jgi:hypothetical protein